jgi:hypothetical protein
VAVDQAGQAGRLIELHDFGAGDVDAATADLLDLVALDNDRRCTEQFAGVGIDQVAAVQGGQRRRRRVIGCESGGCQQRRGDGGGEGQCAHGRLRWKSQHLTQIVRERLCRKLG